MTETRNRQPKGVSTGGQYAAENRPETEAALTPGTAPVAPAEPLVPVDARQTPVGHYAGKPLTIEVAPDRRMWKDTYEADWESSKTIDIAHLVSDPGDLREGLQWAMEEDYGSLSNETGDALAEKSGVLDKLDVSEGFSVRLDAAGAAGAMEWLDDNPAWTQDGTTPHPTGGYTKVTTDDVAGARIVRHTNAASQSHRLDGPAVVIRGRDGRLDEGWYVEGKRVNPTGGPSTTCTYKGHRIEEQWTNEAGEPHREGGPAVLRADGAREWWSNGGYVAGQPALGGTASDRFVVATDGTLLTYDGATAAKG